MQTLISKGLKGLMLIKRIRKNSITTKATDNSDYNPPHEDTRLTTSKPKMRRTRDQERDTRALGALIIERFGQRLLSHTKRNLDTKHINHKIYHLLCYPYTHLNAYVRISKNAGALTKGVKLDQEVSKHFGQCDALRISDKFRTKQYDWMPVRRVMIPKPGKTTLRPIDTPTQENRIAQEAIRGILEAIYEPEFQEFEQDNQGLCTNFGFRPKLSTHLAVERLKVQGQACTYVIEGDISKAYNSMDHQIFLSILSRRIKDKHFLKTINFMLKSGVMHRNQFQHTLIGTPQGGIASPLFFNIYMFELDKYIYQHIISPILIQNSDKTKTFNPTHRLLGRRLKQAINELRSLPKDDTPKRKLLQAKIKSLEAERFKMPSYIPESLPKKAVYTRYADDWVLLVTCTYKEATDIKDKISSFLFNTLRMNLDPDKTIITRLDAGFDFLGFNIKSYSPSQNKIMHKLFNTNNDKPVIRFKQRTTSRKIVIYPSSSRILTNLLRNNFCQGSEYFPIAKAAWTALDEYEILLKFRQTFLGLYNYYSSCDQTYILNRVSYILKFSCAKTISYRQKTTLPKVFQKYGSNLTITKQFIGPNQQVTIKSVYFSSYSELRKLKPFQKHQADNQPADPFRLRTYWRTKFKFFSCCCICQSTDHVALHHINSLKGLKKKKHIDTGAFIRSSLNRLQIPVCKACHLDITYGKYCGISPVEFYDRFMAAL